MELVKLNKEQVLTVAHQNTKNTGKVVLVWKTIA